MKLITAGIFLMFLFASVALVFLHVSRNNLASAQTSDTFLLDAFGLSVQETDSHTQQIVDSFMDSLSAVYEDDGGEGEYP